MPAFWDTNAIIHICVPGQASSAAKALLRDQSPVVWWMAPVEVHSALERLRHDEHISSAAYSASKQRLRELLASWREIQPSEHLREKAYLQLERFRLSASDALHLAAALTWCKQKPNGRLFVCNDERLGRAAHQAGFDIAEV
jgi:predicted nucleic acid-binding protein